MAGRREVKIFITGNSTGGEQAFRRLGAAADDTDSKLARSAKGAADFGDKMSTRVTLPILAVGAAMFDAASDADESLSKVGQVFEDNAHDIEAWSATAAEAMGMTSQQALEAAGTFGNLFSAMGLADDASANMSMGLVQLASDLASFNNADPAEVLENLRAGLLGEAEPMRKFGVQLSAARIEQEALNRGLAASKEELTPAAKAQAAYQIILADTAKAQGDFARTADGAANSLRTAKADIGDAAAELGENLIPHGLKAIDTVSDLVGAFSDLSPEVQGAAVNVALVTAAAGPFLSVGGRLVGAVSDVAGATQGAVTKFQGWRVQMKLAQMDGMNLRQALVSGVRPGLVGVGVALAASAVALGLWVKSKQDAKAATEEYAAALEADGGVIAENTRKTAAQRLEQEGALRAAEQLGIGLEVLTAATLGNNQAQAEVNRVIKENLVITGQQRAGWDENTQAANTLNQVLRAERGYFDDLGDAEGRVESATKGVAGAADGAAGSLEGVAGASGLVRSEARRAADGVEAFTTALDALLNGNIDVEKATIGYRDSVKALRDELKENGDSIDLMSHKGRANRSAILDLVDAARSHVDALIEEGATAEEATGKFNDHIRELKGVMREAGFSEEAIRRYTRRLGLVPRKVRTEVQAEVDKAMTNLERIRAKLAQIPKVHRTRIESEAIRQDITGLRAAGGSVQADRRYIVGERGPEEFRPGVSGVIVPNHRLADSAGIDYDRLAKAIAGAVPRGGDINVAIHNPRQERASDSAPHAMRTARHLAGA